MLILSKKTVKSSLKHGAYLVRIFGDGGGILRERNFLVILYEFLFFKTI